MIDIHSHILPGVDDGAETIEESLAMLRMAAESGTTDIVATPHANSQFPYNPERIQKLFAEVASAAQGIIRVHLGCDFHISFENVQDALEHPTRYTVNNRSHLMVELPDMVIIDTAANVLYRLRSAGMVPVITHPERNIVLQSRLETVRGWVKDGCLLQVTGQSLLGRFGREAQNAARTLMKDDIVHFIASDAHDCEDRTTRLREAYQTVQRDYGAERAERLLRANPAKVLTGDDLDPPAKRKWYQLWS